MLEVAAAVDETTELETTPVVVAGAMLLVTKPLEKDADTDEILVLEDMTAEKLEVTIAEELETVLTRELDGAPAEELEDTPTEMLDDTPNEELIDTGPATLDEKIDDEATTLALEDAALDSTNDEEDEDMRLKLDTGDGLYVTYAALKPLFWLVAPIVLFS